MTSKSTAREEIEARIETLAGQRERTLSELSKCEQFAKKCHDDITNQDALIADWSRVLRLIDGR